MWSAERGSRRRCCRESCTLDSRQAAAKRADRDRRAAHAPPRSPSEEAAFSQTACPMPSTLSARYRRRWQVDTQGNVLLLRERAGASLQKRRRLAVQAMRCRQDEAAAASSAESRWVRDAGAGRSLETGGGDLLGRLQHNTPTSRREHTI